MNTESKFKKLRAIALGLGVLVLSSVSSAVIIPMNLNVLDNDIQVGDTFDVGVSVDFDSSLELLSFAFEVDPLSTLSSDGVLNFQSWQVTPPLLPSLFPNPDLVEGMGDLFNPTMGAIDLQIATLTFEAIGAGDTNLSVLGLQTDFNGLTLYDFANGAFSEFDIDSSVQVSVSGVVPTSVPDVSQTMSMFCFGLLLLVGFRRKMK
ncbi:hypothetical protein MLD52_05790 [Puniceicoccaceae bacterium K14]|nr:hypothetical protein [Puniceicoccaceae bacterium K14]